MSGGWFDRSAVRDAIAAFPLPPVCTTAGAPVRGTSADAWNIAVRTRGVFTHRADFGKPACVERGLVRTGISPVMCHRHTPFSKRHLSSKIFAKSAATCFRPRTKMGGASGAGGLLLNTKASQEAACSRAPAAIVPDHKPARDAGVSRSGESGSHLAGVDAAEGHTGPVGVSGRSGNAGIGSHLAVASVTGAAVYRRYLAFIPAHSIYITRQ